MSDIDSYTNGFLAALDLCRPLIEAQQLHLEVADVVSEQDQIHRDQLRTQIRRLTDRTPDVEPEPEPDVPGPDGKGPPGQPGIPRMVGTVRPGHARVFGPPGTPMEGSV